MASERRWIFLLTVVVALIAATIYALRQPLEFETGALVRVKTPPLPPEFSLHFNWGADFWRSPDVAVQVAKQIKLVEEPQGTWQVVSWLYKNLEITETDGLVTLRLRGGFGQRVVRDALASYIEQVSEKLKSDLRSGIEAESRRLSDLYKALEGFRTQLIGALTARLEERRALLQAQKEGIERELQDFLKPRLLPMRVNEQGATVESWYYRNRLEAFLRRLEGVERELDLLEARGVLVFEGEYKHVRAIEERLESLARSQVEAQQLLEQWEPLEVVTPAQLPQGPVGPDRLQIILWGVGVGVLVGLVLAIFSPRRREPQRQSGSLHPDS